MVERRHSGVVAQLNNNTVKQRHGETRQSCSMELRHSGTVAAGNGSTVEH